MNVYIVPTLKTIYPFEDGVEKILIANRPLREVQIQNIKKINGNPILVKNLDDVNDHTPHLILYDNVYITVKALTLLRETVQNTKRSFRLAIANNHYRANYLWHIDDKKDDQTPVDIFYVEAKQKISQEAHPLSFTCQEFKWDRMPGHMEVNGKAFNYPVTDVGIIPIENWVNLWQANISELMRHAYELEYTKRYRHIIPFILARGSVYKAPLYMNTIGRKCKIHPTAVIEASILGDNVQIGANAVVKLSIIGDNAYVSDQALVRGCILGEEAYIANNNNLSFVVAYPKAFLISGPYQFSVFGRECAIMHCIDCDTRLDKYTIRAQIREHEEIDTNQIYLGSCFGHRVRIGAGTVSAPGMAYKNDLWVNPSPKIVMSNVNEDVHPQENAFLVNGEVLSKKAMKERLMSS